jgi:hypothetical protein
MLPTRPNSRFLFSFPKATFADGLSKFLINQALGIDEETHIFVEIPFIQY